MKKVRTIKILVTTREILVRRSEAQDSFSELTNFSVCPVCSSHLAAPLPVSVEASLAQIEADDDLPTADDYKKTGENFL